MLHPHTRDGAYGKYFDSEASIDFSADLIVLELEELEASPRRTCRPWCC